MELSRPQLKRLHEKSSLHRADFDVHENASCFHCRRVFRSSRIMEWCDYGLTAMCPHCDIDAVLPGKYEKGVLDQMYKRYFKEAQSVPC